MKKKIIYDIYHPGERNTGLFGYDDTIEIIVHSGNPGGEKNEFEEFMESCLAEWFDGAKVTLKTEKEK